MADWARIANTTISNYIKGEEVNILRNRKLTAILKKNGRFSFNWGGDEMNWKVRYKRSPMAGYGDGESVIFPRRNRHKTATLPWRAYATGESITKQETLKNKGKEAIINLFSELATWQKEDCEENFADVLYHDGNATGFTKGFHGIESCLGQSGTSVAYIGTNSDTYAGLSTVLGNYGGSWSGTWPTGTGSPEYDFWTPLLVDYTDSSWESTTDTWANNCIEAMRFAIIKTMKNKSKKGRADMILLNDELYRQFLNALDDKERIQVTNTTNTDELIKLGFGDVQSFDGCTVTTEYGVPETKGYLFNTMQMEVRSMQKTLFVSEGPTYNESDKSWRFGIDAFGNIVLNPRFLAAFDNYT